MNGGGVRGVRDWLNQKKKAKNNTPLATTQPRPGSPETVTSCVATGRSRSWCCFVFPLFFFFCFRASVPVLHFKVCVRACVRVPAERVTKPQNSEKYPDIKRVCQLQSIRRVFFVLFCFCLANISTLHPFGRCLGLQRLRCRSTRSTACSSNCNR